jgi:hypothetical protein
MIAVDNTKLEIEPVPWSDTDRTIRYGGHYVGCVKMIREGEYQCAVSMLRKGEQILQECGRADSVESGAHNVAYQWLLIREHDNAESR